jgi:hypothetical protein
MATIPITQGILSESTIFYKERRLLHLTEGYPLHFWMIFYRILGFLRPCTWKSRLIRPENINRLLSLPAVFLSVNRDLAYFHSFGIRTHEQWSTHRDLGTTFIPRNIFMANENEHCHIVQIDDGFELRHWPGRNLPIDAPDKKKNYPVYLKRTQIRAEQSFKALLIRNGLLPAPEGETRYFERGGSWGVSEYNGGTKAPVLPVYIPYAGRGERTAASRLKGTDLYEFLRLLGAELPEGTVADILRAARQPDAFFDANHERLEREFGIDEPFARMYRHIFLRILLERNILHYVEWNEAEGEIAALLREMTAGRYGDILLPDSDNIAAEVLPVAEKRLRDKGIALLDVDTKGDYYALFLAPLGDVESIIAAGKRCGLTIRFAGEA